MNVLQPADTAESRATSAAPVLLRRLTDALEDAGYFAVVCSFFPDSPWGHEATIAAADLDPQLRATVEMFYLARATPPDRLPGAIVALVDDLAATGLLRVTAEGFSTNGLILTQTLGIRLFYERPNPSMRIYFGPESVALAHRLELHGDDKVLDLCAGPGFQALVAARQCRSVTAVEINPAAAAVLDLNIALNGFRNVRTVCDDFRNAELDRDYDLLIANPPLLPIPPGLRYPFVGAGGPDGLAVTRDILSRADRWLSRDGRLQLIGCTFPLFAGVPLTKRLASASDAPLDIVLTASGEFAYGPGQPLFDDVVENIHLFSGEPRASVAAQLQQHAHANGARAIVCYTIRARQWHRIRVRVINFSAQHKGGWFV